MKYVFYFIISLLLFSQKTFSQRINNSPYPFSSKFDTLFIIYDEDFSADELFTIEVLQGQGKDILIWFLISSWKRMGLIF